MEAFPFRIRKDVGNYLQLKMGILMNNDPEAIVLIEKGNSLFKAKSYEEAIRYYDKALQIEPGNASIWNNKGLCLTELNSNERAIYCYDKALEINPEYIFAWCNRGISLSKISRHEDALLCFTKTLKLDPKSAIVVNNKELFENEITKIQEEKKIEEKKKQAVEFQEKSKKIVNYQTNLVQLIKEIEISADAKPCPRCNELEIQILSLSPNARSLLAHCNHCKHEYRIKMEPDNPQKIILLYNSFLEERNYYSPYRERTVPVWRMEIKRSHSSNQRMSIPTEVKKAVWKRDGGKCVNCGSELELEYDHIIPVAKGGSSTIQNIQILCKHCNRKKHASIQ